MASRMKTYLSQNVGRSGVQNARRAPGIAGTRNSAESEYSWKTLRELGGESRHSETSARSGTWSVIVRSLAVAREATKTATTRSRSVVDNQAARARDRLSTTEVASLRSAAELRSIDDGPCIPLATLADASSLVTSLTAFVTHRAKDDLNRTLDESQQQHDAYRRRKTRGEKPVLQRPIITLMLYSNWKNPRRAGHFHVCQAMRLAFSQHSPRPFDADLCILIAANRLDGSIIRRLSRDRRRCR